MLTGDRGGGGRQKYGTSCRDFGAKFKNSKFFAAFAAIKGGTLTIFSAAFGGEGGGGGCS